MPGPRQFHAAAVWRGELCVLGGLDSYKDVENILSTVECWAGGGSAWHALTSMQAPRMDHGAAVWGRHTRTRTRRFI